MRAALIGLMSLGLFSTAAFAGHSCAPGPGRGPGYGYGYGGPYQGPVYYDPPPPVVYHEHYRPPVVYYPPPVIYDHHDHVDYYRPRYVSPVHHNDVHVNINLGHGHHGGGHH